MNYAVVSDNTQIICVDPSLKCSGIVELITQGNMIRTRAHKLYPKPKTHKSSTEIMGYQVRRISEFVNSVKTHELKLVMIEGYPHPNTSDISIFHRLFTELENELVHKRSMPVDFAVSQRIKARIAGDRYASKIETRQAVQSMTKTRITNFDKTDAIAAGLFGALRLNIISEQSLSLISGCVTDIMEKDAHGFALERFRRWLEYKRLHGPVKMLSFEDRSIQGVLDLRDI